MKMVDAQQARRVLDRLVGYKISPDPLGQGAPRAERRAACSRSRSSSSATASARSKRSFPKSTGTSRRASPAPSRRSSTRGSSARATRPPRFANEAEANAILADLERATFVVSSVDDRRSARRHAVPPFITSKLQQASRFPVKKTMMVAQQLYEGIELPGEEARDRSDHLHANRLGAHRRPGARRGARVHRDAVRRRRTCRSRPNRYKREGHGAGRARSDPADVDEVHAGVGAGVPHAGPVLSLSPDLESVRRLADDAGASSTTRPSTSRRATIVFRAKGSVPKFAGWLAVYGQGTTEAEESERTEQPAPSQRRRRPRRDDDAAERRAAGAHAKGRRSTCEEIKPEQKFTQPPPRFNEGSLVKALEEDGIGRPSTYASIISVLQAREYVNKIEGKFRPDDSRTPARRQAAASGRSTTSSTSSTPRGWKSSSTRSRRARRTTRKR